MFNSRIGNLGDDWATGWGRERTIELTDLKVTLSEPRLVARSKGYCWFPTIVRRTQREVLALMSDVPDVHTDSPSGLAAWSEDGGLTWSRLSAGVYSDCAAIRLRNGDTLFLSNYLFVRPDGSCSGGYVLPCGTREIKPIKEGITIN